MSRADTAVSTRLDPDARPLRSKRSSGAPALRLLRKLADKQRILVTTHLWPDPDAIGSAMALQLLLQTQLKGAIVDLSIKGDVAVGINTPFVKLASPTLVAWDDAKLEDYDAIVLIDVQPSFAYSPLPQGVEPFAIIDHHRARGRRPSVPFVDIRIEAGASTSIVWAYLRQMKQTIDPHLAATMLYAIESDLAGAAGHPGELDNLAMSDLTLVADPRKLYEMRHSPLPREYYEAFDKGLDEAGVAGPVLTTFLGTVNSPEIPALVADFLLRYDSIQWVLVSAVHGKRLVLSLRNNDDKLSAGELMRKLVSRIGEGGGHRAKAGGFIPLENGSSAEIERHRKTLRQRLIRRLELPSDIRFQALLRKDC